MSFILFFPHYSKHEVQANGKKIVYAIGVVWKQQHIRPDREQEDEVNKLVYEVDTTEK